MICWHEFRNESLQFSLANNKSITRVVIDAYFYKSYKIWKKKILECTAPEVNISFELSWTEYNLQELQKLL